MHARLIGAVLIGDETAAARGLGALDTPGWEVLIRKASEDLLTPELAAPLSSPALAPYVPPEVARHLAGLQALNARRNARIAEQAAELLRALASAGLRPLLLKGARAFAEPEPERADRMMIDIDLLLPGDGLDKARAELARLGYRRIPGLGEGQIHALHPFVRDGEPATIDLHREVLRVPHLLPVRAVVGRAHDTQAFGVPVLVADRADEVLHRALHEMLHHRAYRFGTLSIRAMLDVAVQLPKMDAADCANLRARAVGSAAVLLATALRLAQRVFGPGLLPAELAQLARNPLAWAATLRVEARARSLLPPQIDAIWGLAVGGLGAHEHRPGIDGALTAWRLAKLQHLFRSIGTKQVWPR